MRLFNLSPFFHKRQAVAEGVDLGSMDAKRIRCRGHRPRLQLLSILRDRLKKLHVRDASYWSRNSQADYAEPFILDMSVSAIAAGVSATAIPAACSASIFPAAVPFPPEMIAPA